MSKFTDFLNLFMWDSVEDSEEEFNIDKALNDNWKKIDTKVKTHVNSVNEEVNNFKTEVNQKIDNIQALPVGGAKGQVLTKQSETEGDATWEDIEANEVYIGNPEEAPSSAKIIVEEDDLEESSTLGKSEVYVGAEQPTAGEKVWFRKGKNYLDISKLKSRTSYGITLTPTDTGIKISGTATDTYAYGEKISIALKKGVEYTLSGKNAGNILKIVLLKQDASTIIMNVKTVNDEITFIPTEDVFYIQFVLEGITKSTTYDYEISNLQIEQGLKTPYEDYIEQKIYVRNSNGVYEEFIKKQEEQVLWTNPSPSLSFSEQTISIDLSKYSKIYIVYKGKNTDTNFQVTGLFDIGKKYFINNASFFNFTRPVEVTQNSVIFNSDYYYKELGNTATTIQNDYNIPYQIIGLKEV